MKPLKKDILAKTTENMQEWMSNLNFTYKKSYEEFICNGIESNKIIGINLINLPTEMDWQLTFFINIRFHEIENILNKYKPYILKKDSSRTVTVVRAMIDLCNVSPLVISSIDDIIDNADLIKAQIENCALPYLMKYSSIYSIKEAFELSQEYWPVQNSITKCEVLLAIYILQKEREKFHQSVEEFREVIRNHRNGYYFDFFCKMTSEMEKNYL